MKYISLSIFMYLLSYSLSAQQNFDIVSYTAPANWSQQQEYSKLTLEKTPASLRPCKIIMYKSEAVSSKGADDFKSQWNKYVKNLYANVKDSMTIETDRVGGWIVYSTISTCMIDNNEVNYIFTTVVCGKKLISLIAITTDENCLNEINNFYTTLEVQGTTEKRKGVIKKARVKFRGGKNMKESVVPKTK